MKKNYQTPSVKVMHVELSNQLMAGSGGQKTGISMGIGGDAGQGDTGAAKRSFSVWDDDEEE